MRLSSLLTLSVILIGALTSGCTRPQDGPSTPSSAESKLAPFETDCGVVMNASVENPVKPKGGIRGRVTVAGGDLLMMNPEKGGAILIKLQGIQAPYSEAIRNAAERKMGELAREDAIFFPAAKDCTTTISGSVGAIGQVFSAGGVSYSESLLKDGYASVEGDACEASLITPCYEALVEDFQSKYAGELEAFLWKPISDSNGRLAIHTSPYDTVVEIGTETGTNSGPGNGYGSLARFSKPGCSYGGNVSVRVLNDKGLPYRFNGETSITIPNGCQRYCIKGGALALCPKR